jgi:POT family proton-dependent oligopeptide transporter
VPYVVGNEAAERLSYHGIRTILVVYMTSHLRAPPGALLADALLGKYRTIVLLSVVYRAGHAALALDETRVGLWVGLTCIAIGSGGIKPRISADVGDQFC